MAFCFSKYLWQSWMKWGKVKRRWTTEGWSVTGREAGSVTLGLEQRFMQCKTFWGLLLCDSPMIPLGKQLNILTAMQNAHRCTVAASYIFLVINLPWPSLQYPQLVAMETSTGVVSMSLTLYIISSFRPDRDVSFKTGTSHWTERNWAQREVRAYSKLRHFRKQETSANTQIKDVWALQFSGEKGDRGGEKEDVSGGE